MKYELENNKHYNFISLRDYYYRDCMKNIIWEYEPKHTFLNKIIETIPFVLFIIFIILLLCLENSL